MTPAPTTVEEALSRFNEHATGKEHAVNGRWGGIYAVDCFGLPHGPMNLKEFNRWNEWNAPKPSSS